MNEAGEKIKATGANASADDIADAVGNLIYVDEMCIRDSTDTVAMKIRLL